MISWFHPYIILAEAHASDDNGITGPDWGRSEVVLIPGFGTAHSLWRLSLNPLPILLSSSTLCSVREQSYYTIESAIVKGEIRGGMAVDPQRNVEGSLVTDWWVGRETWKV